MFIKKIPANLLKVLYFCSLLAVLVLGFFIYSNTFDNEFIFDDRNMIGENPVIRQMDIPTIFNHSDGRFIGYLTFAANFHFHQYDVKGYHVVNLGIHLINGLLVAWLVLLISRLPAFKSGTLHTHRMKISVLTALLFITHPVQTQAVSYVVQRFTSLSTLFYVLSLCFYLWARLASLDDRPNWTIILRYILAFTVFIMGVLTKESVYTLPVMIAVIEFGFIHNIKLSHVPKWIWIMCTAVFVLLLAIVVRFYTVTDIFSPVYAYALDVTLNSWTYLISQFPVMLAYIRVLAYPVNLILDYGVIPATSILNAYVLLSLVIVMLIIASAIKYKNRFPNFSLAVFWFFITLSIESSIIPIADLMVEHRLYLPSIGFFLLMIVTVFSLFKGRWIIIPIILFFGLAAEYSHLTWERNNIWQDAFTMWNDNVEKTPLNPRPYSSRGIEYSVRGELEKGFADFNKAIELNPNYVNSLGNRGKYYQSKGMFKEAALDYTRALESDAGYEHIWLNNRSTIYTSMGEWELALDDVNQSIELIPANINNYLKRGDIKRELGDFEDAIDNYSMALQLNPSYGIALFNRMKTYLLMKDFNLARRDFQTCLDWQLPIDMNYIQQVNDELNNYFGNLSEKPNILLISTFGMDTRLLKYLENIPTLLMDEGIVFENAFTTTPQYNGAMMSLITGKNSHQAVQEDLWYNKILARSMDDSTIATTLSNAGYKTVFVGNYFNGYAGMPKFEEKIPDPDFPILLEETEQNPYEFGIPPGWTHWHGITHFNMSNELVFNDDGNTERYTFGEEFIPLNDLIFERVTPFLPRSSAPLFMWVNYPSFLSYKAYDPRYDQSEDEKIEYQIEDDLSDKPQYVREFESSNAFTNDLTMEVANTYYNRLIRQYRTFDQFVGMIMEEINRIGQTENTVIILVSGVGSGISNRYHWQTYLTPHDETIRVPMIMKGPGIISQKRILQPTSIMDIFPTIMDLTQIQQPWLTNGRSLYTTLNSGEIQDNQMHRAVFAELWNIRHHKWNSLPPKYRLFRTDEYKYIEYETGEYEYYDLKSDPEEFDNLYYILNKEQKQSLKAELIKQLGKGFSE